MFKTISSTGSLRLPQRRGSGQAGQASQGCVFPYTLSFLISYITALRIPIRVAQPQPIILPTDPSTSSGQVSCKFYQPLKGYHPDRSNYRDYYNTATQESSNEPAYSFQSPISVSFFLYKFGGCDKITKINNGGNYNEKRKNSISVGFGVTH